MKYEEGQPFPCIQCGLCCQNLNHNYAELDRGDGTCRYFNEKSNACDIYENRPLKCQIDNMYELYFHSLMSREEYINQNIEACLSLISKDNKEEK